MVYGIRSGIRLFHFKEGDQMKIVKTAAVVAMIVLAFAGVALAAEMSGDVKAVDPAKGVLTLSSGAVNVGFDCEKGSLISDVKVGDKVTVVYSEKDGKKIVSEVKKAKKKAAVGC
jgi:Cu/Ag efflux protein CusF